MGWKSRALLLAVALAVPWAAACGDDVIGSNPVGTHAEVGDIELEGVRIASPADSDLPVGADAMLWLMLVNDGAEVERLMEVSSPVASRAEIRWDRACDGQAEVVDALPLLPAGPDPRPTDPVPGPTSPAPPVDDYHVRLVDLTEKVLAGTTVEVTFAFSRSGTVSVDVPVRPSTVPRTVPTGRCADSVTATATAEVGRTR